jgi:hypothetical protein
MCLLASSQAADGTRVASGALDFGTTVGRMDVRGQSGLRLQTSVDVSGGVYNPWNQCSDPECPPGTAVSLYAYWSGGDLTGTLNWRGDSYRLGSEGAGGAWGIAEFEGSVILPEFTDSGTAEVSAPFTFSGQFTPENPGGPTHTEPLVGSGTATLTLEVNYDGSSWQIVRTLYEFTRGTGSTAAAAAASREPRQ